MNIKTVLNMWIVIGIVLSIFSKIILADYQCICSFNGNRPVYVSPDDASDVVGFLRMNACREYLYPIDERWNAILFMQKVIYFKTKDFATSLTTNVNAISMTSVKLTQSTISQQPSVTSTSKSTTPTTTPTTKTPTTTATTTTTTLPMKTSTEHAQSLSLAIPEGHTELCPAHVRNVLSIFKGFLGQYGDYCFELIDVKTQWHNAQRHCTVAGNGFLVHVPNQATQDYIVRFLSNHTYLESIWLGLTDSAQEGATTEGKWTWISGDPVAFTKFGSEFNSESTNDHTLHDCVIMKNDGEWTDVPCGVALIRRTGFGESHSFICQYNVTSKPTSQFGHLTDALVG